MNMPFIIAKFKPAGSLLLTALMLLAISSCNSTSNSTENSGTATRATPQPTTTGTTPAPAATVETPLIVAFGDSLTAGYGLQDSQSYPALLQQRLDERGYRYRVVNAGVSGDTSAGGRRRIDWALKGDVRILILELGANDALRGQPPKGVKENLAEIIEKAQGRKVKVVLAGMEAPPNLGAEYTEEFRSVFRDLAKEHNVALIPFFLAGVGGITDLNQGDGIHPNARGTRVVVENAWRAIEPLLIKE